MVQSNEGTAGAVGVSGLDAWRLTAGEGLHEVQPLTGDVSPRRYFRIVFAAGAAGAVGGTAILATYPAELRETCARFLRTTARLAAAGIRVPRVLGSDCEAGWMLVEDLGLLTLGDWGQGRPWSEIHPFFEHARELAATISRLPVDGLAELNPRLGRELLSRELAQTWELFLEPQGLVRDPALAAGLRTTLDALCATLGDEPPVPCHRDFMARNLMPLPAASDAPAAGGRLAVLDHQDLRLGPPWYDLASLLNDTLFPPPEAEEALLAAALPASERVRFHRAAAQRTLKAVGTYAKFARQGANRHLPLIEPTLARFVKHCSRIPEGADLAAHLAERWGSARLNWP